MKKGTIEKISDNKFNGKHPNGINIGYTKEGLFDTYPKIDEHFYIGAMRTSIVTSIVSITPNCTIFDTLNSTYKLTIHE